MSDGAASAAGPTTAPFDQGGTEPLDLVASCQQLAEETDRKLQNIRKQSNSRTEKVGRTIQAQLTASRDQMAKRSTRVADGRKHTERVRLQVIGASHTADTRRAEVTRKQARWSAPHSAAGSTAPNTPAGLGGGDPRVLGVNTHAAVERASLLTAVKSYAATHKRRSRRIARRGSFQWAGLGDQGRRRPRHSSTSGGRHAAGDARLHGHVEGDERAHCWRGLHPDLHGQRQVGRLSWCRRL